MTGSEHGVIGGDGELGEEVVGISWYFFALDMEHGAGCTCVTACVSLCNGVPGTGSVDNSGQGETSLLNWC